MSTKVEDFVCGFIWVMGFSIQMQLVMQIPYGL